MDRVANSKRFKAFQSSIIGPSNSIKDKERPKQAEQKQNRFMHPPSRPATTQFPQFQAQKRNYYEGSINQSENVPRSFVNRSNAVNGTFANKQRHGFKHLQPDYPLERDNSGFLKPANPNILKAVHEELAEREWNDFNKLLDQFCEHPLLSDVEILYHLEKLHDQTVTKIEKAERENRNTHNPDVRDNAQIQRTLNWVRNSQPGNFSEAEDLVEMNSLRENSKRRIDVETPVRRSVRKLQKPKKFIDISTRKEQYGTPAFRKPGKSTVKSIILTRSAKKKKK